MHPGSRIAARSARPCPSQVPTIEKQRSAAGSPSLAAWVICGPPIAAASPSASWSRRIAPPGARMARSRASVTRALPLAYCSQQPRFPQPHRRPSGTTRKCPGSAAIPHLPRYSLPSMMNPAPMPVPTETNVTCSWPRAAPNLNSAHALALPSFSTVTGRPTRPATLVRSGSPRQARFGAKATVPPASSTKPAAPTPTALAWWRAANSVTTSAITAAVRSGLAAGVARRSVSRIRPRSSTTPAATLVPPTSTPIVRLMRGFFRRLRCRLLVSGRCRLFISNRYRLLIRGRCRLLIRGRCRLLIRGRCRLAARSRLGSASRAGRYRVARRGGTRARLGAPAIGSTAAATRRRQRRLKDRHRILDHCGQRVAHRRYPDIPGWLGLTDEPGGTAQRAPGTLRRLTGQRLGGGGLPHVAGLLVLAQGRADLVGQFAAHPAGTSAQQPTLEVTDQVIARPA